MCAIRIRLDFFITRALYAEFQPSSTMIGDNENDYAAARAAGIPVILMRYGYLRVPPETLAPDAWLDRFLEIPQTLKKFID